jgi:uncharacterized metal-binding protein YceD (DUF177 family)
MTNSSAEWRVPVAVEEIPEAGLHREIEASAEIREALANLANLRNVSEARGVFDLTRRGAGVHVVGRVSARVGQTCVVTLEPMDSVIEEAVDLVFAPSRAGGAEPDETSGRHESADEEPLEPLAGGRLDLGAIATEFLILGIEPYPRKTGVEFEPPKTDDGAVHPFAALEALKKGPGGRKS